VYLPSDRVFVNAVLVREGYARTLTIAPNVEHAAEFARLADAARRAGRGLWRMCAA
jgi:micrococcal nuclease